MERAERAFLQLINIIESERAERAINAANVPLIPQGEVTPSFLASAVVPAAGSTIIDFPVIASAMPTPPPTAKQPFTIVEGFEVTRKGDKIIVGKGKYIKDGEEKEFEGAEVVATSNSLVVFNIQEEKVEVVQDRLPIHHVLEVIL